jgi:hypothetical protein
MLNARASMADVFPPGSATARFVCALAYSRPEKLSQVCQDHHPLAPCGERLHLKVVFGDCVTQVYENTPSG